MKIMDLNNNTTSFFYNAYKGKVSFIKKLKTNFKNIFKKRLFQGTYCSDVSIAVQNGVIKPMKPIWFVFINTSLFKNNSSTKSRTLDTPLYPWELNSYAERKYRQFRAENV